MNEENQDQAKERFRLVSESDDAILDDNMIDKDKRQSNSKKRHKSKHIKKILKERLNIDCLRMLCEVDGPEDQDALHPRSSTKAPPILGQTLNMYDSYHVLMREIGVETNDELSQAFLNKNGEA